MKLSLGMLAAALASGLLVAGCANEPDRPAEASAPSGAGGPGTAAPTAARTQAPTRAPTQAPAPAQGGTDEDAEHPEPQLYPTWDAAARVAAVRAGRAAMVAYARPTLSAAAWWRGLAPLLSPGAATAYAETDPANVPARQVRGRSRLLATPSPYLAEVSTNTDVGAYRVLLSRAGQGAPWLVERLTPPADVGP